jgi:hypothetical protein
MLQPLGVDKRRLSRAVGLILAWHEAASGNSRRAAWLVARNWSCWRRGRGGVDRSRLFPHHLPLRRHAGSRSFALSNCIRGQSLDEPCDAFKAQAIARSGFAQMLAISACYRDLTTRFSIVARTLGMTIERPEVVPSWPNS